MGHDDYGSGLQGFRHSRAFSRSQPEGRRVKARQIRTTNTGPLLAGRNRLYVLICFASVRRGAFYVFNKRWMT